LKTQKKIRIFEAILNLKGQDFGSLTIFVGNGQKIVGVDTIAVKLCFILPLTTSLSSIIDDWQGKIKRFSLGNRRFSKKNRRCQWGNTALILIT
jgi:hypothetical protein